MKEFISTGISRRILAITPTLLVLFSVLTLLVFSGGMVISQFSGKPQQEWEDFDPTNFDNPTKIDNEWMPMKPGKQLAHEGTSLEEGERVHHRIELTITDLTKEIDGVQTVVVWIVDYRKGELIEKEVAFFAQDNDGNVWLFGEYPEAYENGILVEAPTWIAGLQDARPGIMMQADPKEGTPSYSQGWGPAVDWTDRAQVYKMGQKTCVPVDCYEDVLIMDEFNYKEPGFKQKYYARGVGHVRVGWRGDEEQQETLELVGLKELSPEELAEVRKKSLELEKDAYKRSKDVYAHTKPIEQPGMGGSK